MAKLILVLKAFGWAAVATIVTIAALVFAYGTPTLGTLITRSLEIFVVAYLVFLYVYFNENKS